LVSLQNIEGIRVLIVDDIPINGQLMDERMTLMGMRPTYVRQTDMVIKTMSDAANDGDPFQMAILDYLMPGMNGEDLAKQIKANPITSDTALIMLSSAGGRSYSKRFQDAGFSSYLSKPIRANELEETIALVWRDYSAGNTTNMIEYTPATSSDDKPDIGTVQFSNPNILIAEDNRTNQSVVQEILEQAGCVIDIAVNGKEAIKKIANGDYDLVYMDCEMPEMDGFEATQLLIQMKSDHIIGDIPIVALTANADQSDRQKCIDAGMVDYMSKPLRKNDLLEMTVKWLSNFVQTPTNIDQYRFDDYTVLLVEDNRTNQMLAEEVLGDLGFKVSHAANGQIAVDMAQDTVFDLILMDCQMPVMDGFEATQVIRTNTAYIDTPIIALTANAMKGDRTRCLDAGMVDYMSKPLRKNTLISTVSKWIKPRSNTGDELGDDIIQYLDAAILDEDILRSYQAVIGEKFKSSAEAFLHEARMFAGQILTAFDAQDIETIHRQSHQLKSSSAIMGAMELSELCTVIEAEAFEFIQYHKGDDHVFDGRFVSVINIVFKRVAPLLDTYIQKQPIKGA
jgi:CheY-like chemotaxis protein/HPt (histidine-containing phosphotransfer) domain-containing protein